MRNRANTFISLICALFFAVWSGQLLATDLEAAPDRDTGDIDNAADSFSAEDIPRVSLVSVEAEIVLDGILDEPFWADAEILPITTELYPERFAEASVATRARVITTPTHLYIGFEAEDPDVSKIRSADRERDSVKDGDYVSVVIDPTGQLRRKFEFRINPHGSRADILQDTISDRYWYDWDTRWEASAAFGENGYTAEMAIPLDSIKQPRLREGEEPFWLVVLKRSYPREVDKTFGSVFIFKRELTDTERSHRRRVELQPYYIYYPEEERDPGEDFTRTDDHNLNEAGIDAKLILDSSTAVALTINPNYTDVEADIARDSINNPFTPFQPEKRRFFQDSRELYSTQMPLVYTRNIVQPDYGLDFSHFNTRYSTGGLWVQDKDTRLVMPDNLGSDTVDIEGLESDSLATRYVTGEKGSSLGLVGTFRTGSDYKNYVLGVDGLVNLGIDDKIRYQVTWSETNYPASFADDLCEGDDCSGPPPEDCVLGECDYTAEVLRANPLRDLSGHGLRLQYKHDGPEGLYWVNYFDYSEDFRADFGLEKRTDYRQLNAAYGKKWYRQIRRKDQGKSRIRGYVVGNIIQNNAGEQIENGLDLWGEFRGTLQTVFRLGYRIKERAVNRIDQGSLALGDNAPLFDEGYAQWYYETSPIRWLVLNLDGRLGEIADADNLVLGDMTEVKPKFTLLLSKLRLSLGHTYRDFETDGQTLWRENFTTVQGVYRPKKGHAFRLLLLRDTTDRDTTRYVGDELASEKETEFEFTYLYQRPSGLNILAGIKVEREEDSETAEYTSGRLGYIKFVYDFGRGYDLDRMFDRF